MSGDKVLVETLTLVAGNLRVSIEKSSITISEIGPRGGSNRSVRFTRTTLAQFRAILDHAEAQQALLRDSVPQQLGAGS